MRCLVLVAAAALVLCSCTVTLAPELASKPAGGTVVTVLAPTKAHLFDGSVVLFAGGLTLSNDVLLGNGVRFDLLRRDSVAVSSVPLESVAALERYDRHSNPGGMLALAGIPASALMSLAGSGSLTPFFKSLFGSCPTVYTWDGTAYTLEADGFSFNVVDVAAHSDYWYFAVPPAVCCLFGTGILVSHDPKVDFQPPFDTSARTRLALFCRYPQGLTAAQANELLRFQGQGASLGRETDLSIEPAAQSAAPQPGHHLPPARPHSTQPVGGCRTRSLASTS